MNEVVGGVEFRPSGVLIQKAMNLLSRGPATTAAVAEEVLALRGNPSAAASAVFALLGADSRFDVDEAGVWSLASPRALLGGSSLRDEDWVVVDVETTGGVPGFGHRVIEVGAVVVSGGRIVETYSSLVHPGRPIPRVISSLTGITNDEVMRAPRFESIAPRLREVLAGRIFVAHNANFDWRFLCAEMERCTGSTLAGRRLCTVRLARRLVPHLPSRALGALAHHYGIEMTVHHRALPDAEATARLLIRFFDFLEDREITDWKALESFMRTRPIRPRRRRRSAMPRSMDIA